jgi:hypothetical protein
MSTTARPRRPAQLGPQVEITAAIVDRLTFAGNILETGTDSYRLAYARAQRTT